MSFVTSIFFSSFVLLISITLNYSRKHFKLTLHIQTIIFQYNIRQYSQWTAGKINLPLIGNTTLLFLFFIFYDITISYHPPSQKITKNRVTFFLTFLSCSAPPLPPPPPPPPPVNKKLLTKFLIHSCVYKRSTLAFRGLVGPHLDLLLMGQNGPDALTSIILCQNTPVALGFNRLFTKCTLQVPAQKHQWKKWFLRQALHTKVYSRG